MYQRRNDSLWGSVGSMVVSAALLAVGPSVASASISAVGRLPLSPTAFRGDLYPNTAEGIESVQQQTTGQERDDHLSPWTEPDGDSSEVTPDDSEACLCDCADSDGWVDITDLLKLLSQWGTPGPHDCDVSGPRFQPGGAEWLE